MGGGGGAGGVVHHTAYPVVAGVVYDITVGTGGAGGSGVVILRMATANYSGTTSGSPTVSTDGSDTILVYNASGTYTA